MDGLVGQSTVPSHEHPLLLILGRRGSGKRTLAKEIHRRSARRRRMFRAFDCRSCSELEARRVFLGEVSGSGSEGRGQYIKYLGLLEEVSDGTLYLDEVDRLPFDMQRILAEVLQTRRFRPIGADSDQEYRGKLFVASSKNLAELTESGEFHQQFYLRVAQSSIQVGPRGEVSYSSHSKT